MLSSRCGEAFDPMLQNFSHTRLRNGKKNNHHSRSKEIRTAKPHRPEIKYARKPSREKEREREKKRYRTLEYAK